MTQRPMRSSWGVAISTYFPNTLVHEANQDEGDYDVDYVSVGDYYLHYEEPVCYALLEADCVEVESLDHGDHHNVIKSVDPLIAEEVL